MSIGLPVLFSGSLVIIPCFVFLSDSIPFVIAVSIIPGWIELTLIPSGPYSAARDFVSSLIPPLLAQYAAACEYPIIPATDEMLIIDAPFSMCFSAACEQRKCPFRFMSIVLSQSSSVRFLVSPGMKTPALLTRMSIFLNCLIVCCMRFSTCCFFEMSVFM